MLNSPAVRADSSRTLTFATHLYIMKPYLLLALSGLFISSCGNNDTGSSTTTNSTTEAAPPLIGYSVINTLPHDTSFYTEGFELHDGTLYESSGSGSAEPDSETVLFPSAFGAVDSKTGKVAIKASLDNKKYFGEGITFFGNKVYQLTWKNQQGFVYDAKTFKKLGEFSYTGEGWALTHDSTHLIMSDGSSNLRIIDPSSIPGAIKVVNILGVTDNNGPVGDINELEYANGFIYANQYRTNYILKIDPSNGKVLAKMDMSKLDAEARAKHPNAEVLNGIAFNPANGTFYVTGKNWPLIYEIRLN